MSFGYGVSDFVGISTLAWNVYKSCRDAPQSFGNVASEVSSLVVVLKEAEEMVSDQHLPPAQLDGLKVVADGCRRVLEDLQKVIERYESLGTQGKRTWDRMKWCFEDVTESRTRLVSNIVLLNAWIR
jgi:hypothetical protein